MILKSFSYKVISKYSHVSLYIYIYRSDIADAHLEAMLYITYKTINNYKY